MLILLAVLYVWLCSCFFGMTWWTSRVWLEPAKETNTYGRDNFSIHGGEEPGSAGCIDLTSEMPAFADWFKKNGKDLIIKVKY